MTINQSNPHKGVNAAGGGYSHTETVPCDYQQVAKCEKILPPGRGIPHPVFIGPTQEKVIRWCCLPCDMEFDDE